MSLFSSRPKPALSRNIIPHAKKTCNQFQMFSQSPRNHGMGPFPEGAENPGQGGRPSQESVELLSLRCGTFPEFGAGCHCARRGESEERARQDEKARLGAADCSYLEGRSRSLPQCGAKLEVLAALSLAAQGDGIERILLCRCQWAPLRSASGLRVDNPRNSRS